MAGFEARQCSGSEAGMFAQLDKGITEMITRYPNAALVLLVLAGMPIVPHAAFGAETANVQMIWDSQDMYGSEDVLASFFVTGDLAPESWLLRPELGFGGSFDPIWGGDQYEWSAGLAHYWTPGNLNIWLAGGYSFVQVDWGANTGSANSYYARAGAAYMWGRFGVGGGVRYLDSKTVDVDGLWTFPVGYLQWEFNMFMRFKF
jgi:hypothetical protein